MKSESSGCRLVNVRWSTHCSEFSSCFTTEFALGVCVCRQTQLVAESEEKLEMLILYWNRGIYAKGICVNM